MYTEIYLHTTHFLLFDCGQMSERQMTFTTLNLLLMVVALCLCYRSCQSKPLHPDLQFLLDTMPRHPPPTSTFPRRNSDVALPMHHDPDLTVGAGMKKGCSVANLGTGMHSSSMFRVQKQLLRGTSSEEASQVQLIEMK